MARQSKAKFTMKGHTLPGINKKSETANIEDGRSPSSAFQQNSPVKNYKDTTKYKAFEGGNEAGSAFQQKKELSVTDRIKAGVSAVADWDGPFSDYSLYDGYKHKKKQLRKGDEISSRDTKGTGAAGKMKSPLAQMTYTCPECGDEFETFEQMGNHLQSAHLGGGSGSPGAGRDRDQTSGLDSEEDNRPTRNTNPR